MITYNQVERVRQETIEFNHYSIRLWIVLSLILSLASMVILSKRQMLDHRALYAAALVVPLAFTLYFRNRIVRLGPFVYVATLVGMLAAAVFFGI
jgi:hypothetical protein